MQPTFRLALTLGLTAAAASTCLAGSASADHPGTPSAIRINSGGSALTDSKGRSWIADTYVTGGRSATVAAVTSDTPDVDRSERYGAMVYAIPVSSTTNYLLRLHLTEVWFRTAGARVFNVKVEGRTVASQKDILAEGPRLVTQILEVPVQASDGSLTVEFTNVVNNATVSAIEVLPEQQDPTEDLSPSGMKMPTGDQSAYQQVFTDDFPGSSINTNKWSRYSGVPGSDPGTRWAPSHVTVGNGLATLSTFRDPAYDGVWTSGGINNAKSGALSAGKWEIRMRADSGTGLNVVGLLWPAGTGWPPEIDFVEDRDGDRQDFTSTLHYTNDGHKMIHGRKVADMTRWHTYGVEWAPGRLTYTMDGQPWKTILSSFVPTVKMGLAVQSNAVTRGAVKADATTPAHTEVEIDWVVGYRPAS